MGIGEKRPAPSRVEPPRAVSGVEPPFDRLRGVSRVEPLRARLMRRPLWADGALGTMLRAEGLGADEPPELWTLARPEAVAAVHAAYLAVGCDLVTANTFGANRLRLRTYGLDGQIAEINRKGVRIARGAASGDHLVAAAIGPTGGFQRGRRIGPEGEIRAAFEEQMAVLAEAGVDLILVETMTHLAEARVALEASRSSGPVPVAVTLVFFDQGGTPHTLDGASPGEAVRDLGAADMLGCNCVEVEMALAVLEEMQEATTLPLVVQPHAGLPGTPRTPEAMARFVPALLTPAVGIFGGCCGTTPTHLQALIQAARHA